MTEHTPVLIIGSGPAGLTAAIYSARAQLNPIVVEGEPSSTTDQPGGQLMLTTEIENFPGFPEGLTGPELMLNMRKQAERFGADLRTAKVATLDARSRPFRAWLTDDTEPSITADAVILATGAQSLMMKVPGEDRLYSHGLSTCATCDGFFFRGQDIAVAATRRLKRRPFSPASRRASLSCTGAIHCEHPRSCRDAPSPTRRFALNGIPRSPKYWVMTRCPG
jgi:thioredoxin reductase (NADPH)